MVQLITVGNSIWHKWVKHIGKSDDKDASQIVSFCSCSFNSFLASGDFCCLLITFAITLDPDHCRQILFLKEFFEKKVCRRQQKQKK